MGILLYKTKQIDTYINAHTLLYNTGQRRNNNSNNNNNNLCF